jgi:hypothetical protein
VIGLAASAMAAPAMAVPGIVVPGVGGTCSAAATALGPTGAAGVCQVAGAAAGAAGSAASQVAGDGISSVLGDLGHWVADGAAWVLGQIGSVIGSSTSIELGASWFTTHYATMAELAGVVIVPLLLLGIIQSVYRQNLSALLRSVLVNVPLAILLTAVAVQLVQLGLAVTDALSAAVAHGAGLDAGTFMSPVIIGLSAGSAAGIPGVPTFLLFLGALAVVVGAVLVWVELLIRAAAVYVAVLFLPLALASLAWPAISHWCRRLVDTLVALILGKFVIVSVLSLAAGALAGSIGATPSGGTAGTAGSGGGGFTAVLGAAALLFLSAFAPWALFRLLPFVEAGAVGHLEGLSQRAHQTVTAPTRTLAQTAMRRMANRAVASGGEAIGKALGGGRGGGHGGRGGGGGGGAGGDGSPDPGPDLGPSSVESTGVGTVSPPGSGVPMYDIHAGVTAGMKESGFDDPDGPGIGEPGPASSGPASSGPASGIGAGSPSDPGGASLEPLPGSSTSWLPASGPPGADRAGVVTAPPAGPGLVPLPRQTAARHDDYLGRDRMGPKLVTRPRTDISRPGQSDPTGG